MPTADGGKKMQKPFNLEDPKLPDWVENGAQRSGGFPYDDGLDKHAYKDQLKALQIELVKLQQHMGEDGGRVMVLMEGRDAAGKGGVIKRYLANLNHRHARVVALDKPTQTEIGQWYFQRYAETLPTRGEQVLYDRSWYNRAVVEPVMGFCTQAQTAQFLEEAPHFESLLVKDGIRLYKFWLEIGREMQLRRFHDRRHDPLKVWKLSPVDLNSMEKWDDYTAARNVMLVRTHTDYAPWTVIRANDKRRARIAVIRSVLDALDYAGRSEAAIGKTDEAIVRPAPDFLNDAAAGD